MLTIHGSATSVQELHAEGLVKSRDEGLVGGKGCGGRDGDKPQQVSPSYPLPAKKQERWQYFGVRHPAKLLQRFSRPHVQFVQDHPLLTIQLLGSSVQLLQPPDMSGEVRRWLIVRFVTVTQNVRFLHSEAQ